MNKYEIGALILVIGAFIGMMGLSFIISAGIIWLICGLFRLAFSWRAALAIWLILVLLSGGKKSKDKKDN